MYKLIYNTDKHDVQERMNNIDLVCVDLDQCLFPYFVQTVVALSMYMETLLRPSYWRYAHQLTAGAGFMLKHFYRLKDIPKNLLMNTYEHVMYGIPRNFIERHARHMHRLIKPHSLSFLTAFKERSIPIVVLSLTIQPILDVFRQQVPCIDTVIGNGIEFLTDPEPCFIRYGSHRIIDGAGKLMHFQNALETFNARCPLVIGHSADELPLVECARAQQGVSIGISPFRKVAGSFDVVLRSYSWKPLRSLLNDG